MSCWGSTYKNLIHHFLNLLKLNFTFFDEFIKPCEKVSRAVSVEQHPFFSIQTKVSLGDVLGSQQAIADLQVSFEREVHDAVFMVTPHPLFVSASCCNNMAYGHFKLLDGFMATAVFDRVARQRAAPEYGQQRDG